MKKKILSVAIALTMATTVSACSSTLSQQQTAQVVGGLGMDLARDIVVRIKPSWVVLS